jgi:hypothetical protein
MSIVSESHFEISVGTMGDARNSHAQAKRPKKKKKKEMTEDEAEKATLRGMKLYKYPCPACSSHKCVHLGNTVKLVNMHKVQCMSCGAISANNSREPEYNEFVNITQAKKILEAVLAEFASEKASFDEVIQMAGTDPSLVLEHVMPMAMEIQMNVFSRFGFDRSIYGIRHCLQELRKHSRDDVIANMLIALRATICSPAHWAASKRLEDEKKMRAKEEKLRLEREEADRKIRLARERKERAAQQEKALELELVLGDVNASDIITEHPPTDLVLWPHTAVQLKVKAAAPKKFDWFFMAPADDAANHPHTNGFWRDGRVKHPLTPAGDFYVQYLDEHKPARRKPMSTGKGNIGGGGGGRVVVFVDEGVFGTIPGADWYLYTHVLLQYSCASPILMCFFNTHVCISTGVPSAAGGAVEVLAERDEGLAYVPRNRVRLDGRMDDARLPGQAWQKWDGHFVHACAIDEDHHNVELCNALRPWGGVRGKKTQQLLLEGGEEEEKHKDQKGGNHIQEFSLYSSFAGKIGVSMLVLPDVGSCDGAAGTVECSTV